MPLAIAAGKERTYTNTRERKKAVSLVCDCMIGCAHQKPGLNVCHSTGLRNNITLYKDQKECGKYGKFRRSEAFIGFSGFSTALDRR
jgi:hypothetical protein